MNHQATLFDVFKQTCQQYPLQDALVLHDQTITYAALLERVDAWSQDLLQAGFLPQEKVMIIVDEYVNFIVLWFALWQIGCIPIPFEPSMPAPEIQAAASESAANRLVTNVSSSQALPALLMTHSSTIQPEYLYGKLHTLVEDATSPDTALFFYTSGTTGAPKCVVFDHDAMAANVISLIKILPLSEKDVVLTPLSPMLPATIATAMLPALCAGSKLVLLANAIPGNILQNIRKMNVTVFYAVPYIYRLLTVSLGLRKTYDWSSIRLCLSSSAFLENSVFDAFFELTKCPIRSIYCTSEAGACAYNDSDDVRVVRESVGRPLPDVQIHIPDTLEDSTRGELLVSGPHIARGYYCQPELQNKVFLHGQVKTGDLGSIDTHGYIHLYGRLSDTINVSGYLVNPREVEQVLLHHPDIAEALVFGAKDEQVGEVVAAYLVVHKGKKAPVHDELVQFCLEKIGHYKVPRRFSAVEELPTGRYGKMKRPS